MSTTSRKLLIFAPDEDILDSGPIDWSQPRPAGIYRSAEPVSTEDEVTLVVADAQLEARVAPETRPVAELLTAQMDSELDLRHDLKSLNRARDENKVAMQERLYELHKLMAGTGRAGKFAPFLREDLGWTEKYAYTKAMRWIAAHELRVGLIDEATYDKRMGNGSTTLRSDSPPATDAVGTTSRPVAPTVHQTFTVEVDDAVEDVTPPTFTAQELARDTDDLAKRRAMFYSTVLFRAYYPTVYHGWLRLAWKTQRQRHGTKTYAETIAAISLLGLKPAAEDDEWDQCMDQILHDIGRNPAVAMSPDWVHPDDREEGISPPAGTSSMSQSSVSAVEVSVADSSKGSPDFEELTMDDFDDNDAFRS